MLDTEKQKCAYRVQKISSSFSWTCFTPHADNDWSDTLSGKHSSKSISLKSKTSSTTAKTRLDLPWWLGWCNCATDHAHYQCFVFFFLTSRQCRTFNRLQLSLKCLVTHTVIRSCACFQGFLQLGYDFGSQPNQISPYLKEGSMLRQHASWQLTDHIIKLRYNYWTSFRGNWLFHTFSVTSDECVGFLESHLYIVVGHLRLHSSSRFGCTATGCITVSTSLNSPSLSASRGLGAHLPATLKWPHNAQREVFRWKCWTHDISEVCSCATVRRENVITLKTWEKEKQSPDLKMRQKL